MTLILKLRFHTAFGQSLLVTGNHPLLGDGDPASAVPLEYLDDEFWQVSIPFPRGTAIPKSGIRYNYIFRLSDGSTVTDWGNDHVLSPELFGGADVLIVDSWNAAASPENTFYTEPFKEVLLRANQTQFAQPVPAKFSHTFKVKAPLLAKGQTLALLGNTSVLGNWDTTKPLLLNRTPDANRLSVNVDLSGAAFPLEYKYGVFDVERNSFVAYETGNNRRLNAAPDALRLIVDDGFAALPTNAWRGAGVAIPVFSLRTEKSFGVGEFTDLKPLADWCAATGLKLIQILPVNDTTSTHTWVDSYPYSAISAFALHPVYLNLREATSAANRSALEKLEAERQRLNALQKIDYEAVMRTKLAFLKQIFPSQKTATFRSRDYKTFFDANQHWLRPYAVFCFLRDKFGTADSRQWPEHTRCTPETLEEFTTTTATHYDEVAFHFFLQFHLHSQLLSAAAHAHTLGVVLKGDIAIGVSRNGADTWQSPDLYDLSVQAGAPPDPFADKGQNWGFPTYNWPRMAQDGFAWWKQRFAQMGCYFDAFRIDHILGFFRIWSIPANAVEGILGHFEPAIPVELNEFAVRGIAFDRARFVEPFINDGVLEEIFGADADVAKQTFLQPMQERRLQAAATGKRVPLPPEGGVPLSLRPEFATQRQVEQHFTALPATPANEKLKLGLYDLISNVLFFEVEGSHGRQFHFRFDIAKTASFRALDPLTQEQLMELYVDYFFRRQDEFWRKQAMQKLPALKRTTDMLICGEDLGLVPGCVPDVMRDLGLLSLEIQRMPKTPGLTFSRPADAPYLSVVTPSTHDMSTIRGWWEEDAPLTQRFFNDELGRSGPAPVLCSGELNAAVVHQHLASPAMWSIFQLQDLLGMDETLRRENADAERINIPANPKHYWCYRMHLTLESLLGRTGFNHRLREMAGRCGRQP